MSNQHMGPAGVFNQRSGYPGDTMDLEEHTLETAEERCAVCGAQLTSAELRGALEAEGPSLCSVHAAEEVPLEDEDPGVRPEK